MTDLRLPDEIRDTRAPLLALVVACVLAVTFIASLWVHGCRMDGEDHIDCVGDCSPANEALESCREHLGEHEAFDVQAEHESALIAADLAGYERCMYAEKKTAALPTELQTETDAVNDSQGSRRNRSQAADSPGRVSKSQKPSRGPIKWPQVLSVFTSTNPDKPDKLAGSSSAWPLPPGPVTMENMVPRGTRESDLPPGWARRRVRHDDFGVALRGAARYTRVRIRQVIDGAECSVVAPAITSGPFGALCLRRDDCSPGRMCRRQVGDITRPGDETVYFYTFQVGGDDCEYRGAVDITPAVLAVCGFLPMKPVTVTRIRTP